MYLVGQKTNKELIDNGKLDNANFIIIKGPSSFGKTYLVEYIANHYGMLYKKMDNSVDQIRKLNRSTVNRGIANVLYHFPDFEKSSNAAKAALLKISEETPEGGKIVITTSAFNVLQTLVSRAYNMNIAPYSKEEVEEYADNLGFDKALLDKLVNDIGMRLTPSILVKYKKREDMEEIITLAEYLCNALMQGIKLSDISFISNKFWNDDYEKVQIFLETASCIIMKNIRPSYKYISCIEETKVSIDRYHITNFKNAIQSMLMEMI